MHRLHPYPDVQVMFRRLLIATLIGLLAALAVALFRHAMVVLETLLLSNDSGSLVNAAQSLPAWRRLVTPALGGLTAGTLLWLWQRRSVARPHAATDYMEALETGDGCFDTPASLVKSLASLLVVVTGSAIGREGAMILLAALAASLFARRFTPQSEWKLWVACGAAAGMASAYHAPLAGSLFIAEILFGTLMLASLGPVVISAVIALLLTQFLNGGAAPLYHVVLQQNLSALHYGLMLATGLLAGLCGPLFIWLMDYSHRGFVKLKLAPPWQLALGGLIVGGLSLITPAVWGNGYSVVQSYLLLPPSGALLVYALWYMQISNATRDGLKETALAVARTMADMPQVKRGLEAPPQQKIIQPLAQAITRRNDLLYAIVTDMQGIRYSHPDSSIIGKPFIGHDIQPTLQGKENVAINHGVLAPALRVFTPVFNERHQQIGVVVVGISLSKVDEQIANSRWDVLLTILFSALVCALGTWSLVRGLKRVLLGLEPHEISTQFQQRQAMLHALKEGVVAVDAHGEVNLINPAAEEILFSGPDKTLVHSPLLDDLQTVLQSGEPMYDRELGCNGLLLIGNTVPIRSQGAVVGAICTFRDKTEVSQLLQRLDGMMSYVDALRTTSHEFMNKLHVILGLLNMKSYGKLEEYVLQTAHRYQADIGDIQHRIKSPVVAGFLISKIQRATECGFTLTLAEESLVPDCPNEKQVTVLVTVLGNLIENALDAMSGQAEGEIGLLLHYQDGWLSGEVSDDGPGIPENNIDAIFNKGFSTKGENRGVGLFLANQQLRELGGTLAVESEPGVFTQFFVHLPWDSKRKPA